MSTLQAGYTVAWAAVDRIDAHVNEPTCVSLDFEDHLASCCRWIRH
jgi:hypothetical protein